MTWINLAFWLLTIVLILWLVKLSTIEEPLKKIVRVVYIIFSVLFLLIQLGILGSGGGPILKP